MTPAEIDALVAKKRSELGIPSDAAGIKSNDVYTTPVVPGNTSQSQNLSPSDIDQMTHSAQLSVDANKKPLFSSMSDIGQSAEKGTMEGLTGAADLLLGSARTLGPLFGIGETGYTPFQMNNPPRDKNGNFNWKSLIPTGFDSPISEEAQKLLPDVYNYKPTSYAGDLTQTATSMLPGMAFPAGEVGGPLVKLGSRFVRNVAAPAIGSEVAGNIAHEYLPQYEGAARFLGGIGGGLLSAVPEMAARSAIGHAGEEFPLAQETVDLLRSRGINPSVGSLYGLPKLRDIEGSVTGGQFGPSTITNQFTDAVAQTLGLPRGSKLTFTHNDPSGNMVEGTINAHKKSLGNIYDYIHGSTDVTFDKSDAQSIIDSIKLWRAANNLAPNRVPPVEISTLLNKVERSSNSGVPIPAGDLQNFRTQLNALAKKGVMIASDVKSVLDNALGRELQASGRSEDYDLWLNTNRKWRDTLAVQEAVERAPSQIDRMHGTVTPEALLGVLQSHGFGPNEPLMRLSEGAQRSGSSFNGPRAVIQHGRGAASIGDIAKSVLAGTFPSAYLLKYGMPSDIPSALKAAGVVLGAAGVKVGSNFAKKLGRKYLASNAGQRYAEGLATTHPNSVLAPSMVAAELGSGPDDRTQRKAGGRVADHLTAADQLVRAAERAKKGQSAQTEALLQQPDSAVAHALEVANRSI